MPKTPGITADLTELLSLRSMVKRARSKVLTRLKTHTAGQYQSKQTGRGMDFAETRQYQPGDDIRTMDWKVLARTGEPHTKIFHAERERPVFVIVFATPSLYFGTRNCFKSVLAAKLASLLTWHALARGDRVGGVVASGDNNLLYKPKMRATGVLPFVQALSDMTESEKKSHEPDIKLALQQLDHIAKAGSEIHFIGDFFEFDESYKSMMKLISRHTSCFCWQVFDPIEKQIDKPNTYHFSDGDKQVALNLKSRSEKARYQRLFEKRAQALEQFCHQTKMQYKAVATDCEFDAGLLKGLEA